MKKVILPGIYFLFATLILISCSGQTPFTPTPNITNTPDLCGPDTLPSEVEKVHKHMREFDDASMIATNVPLDKLAGDPVDILVNGRLVARGAGRGAGRSATAG